MIICIVVAGVASALWVRPSPDSSQDLAQPQHPQVSPEKIPLVTGDEPIPAIFKRAGCSVCHAIRGIPGAAGRVGPALMLGTTGPQRLADPRYRGQAATVREYIIESILTPSVYVVPGYPDRTMPQWYGRKLTATALDKIAAFLEEIRVEQVMDQPDEPGMRERGVGGIGSR